MTVNSDARVAYLNANKVDGQDATLKPLVASVNQTANLDTSAGDRGAASVRKSKTDAYEVTCDRGVSGCPRVEQPPGRASTVP
jgi:hypothetical protein